MGAASLSFHQQGRMSGVGRDRDRRTKGAGTQGEVISIMIGEREREEGERVDCMTIHYIR
jgi:hypothetical protein